MPGLRVRASPRAILTYFFYKREFQMVKDLHKHNYGKFYIAFVKFQCVYIIKACKWKGCATIKTWVLHNKHLTNLKSVQMYSLHFKSSKKYSARSRFSENLLIFKFCIHYKYIIAYLRFKFSQ